MSTWAKGRQAPDTALLRFVAHRFPYTATCLDIGSGEGANARELSRRGSRVFSIDKDPTIAHPLWNFPEWHVCDDICQHDYKGPFDLIYDINTLCHVEYPPWKKIASWLKPERGIFFSICPTYNAPPYIGIGKEFTRTYAELGLRETLKPYFGEVTIYRRTEPDFLGHDLDSWIGVARP